MLDELVNVNTLIAAGAVILPNVGGALSGLSVPKNLPWYDTVKKPSWRPPNWIFGPAWTTLYSTMGYASYMVFRDGGGLKGPAMMPLMCYGGQLALNLAWSPIFFKYHSFKWALFDIAALDLGAIATAVLFYQVKPLAGLLMLPYLAWLGYATALTVYIYKENPSKDKPN